MPLFLFIFHIFTMYIHSFNHIHTTHLSVAIRRGLSPFLHRFEAQWESLPVVPSREYIDMKNVIKYNKKIKGWHFLIMLFQFCETFKSKDIEMPALYLFVIFYYIFHINQDFKAKLPLKKCIHLHLVNQSLWLAYCM